MRVFAVAFAMTAVVSAFAPVRFARPSTKIFNDLDSSEAVKAAMEASEKFGKSSKEARIAWETVEVRVVDAVNHEAYNNTNLHTRNPLP